MQFCVNYQGNHLPCICIQYDRCEGSITYFVPGSQELHIYGILLSADFHISVRFMSVQWICYGRKNSIFWDWHLACYVLVMSINHSQMLFMYDIHTKHVWQKYDINLKCSKIGHKLGTWRRRPGTDHDRTGQMFPWATEDNTTNGRVHCYPRECKSFYHIGYKQWLLERYIPEEDGDKTAFASHAEFFRFRRMSFGLMNSPDSFQRALESILSKDKWTTALVHLDDLITYSETVKEHFDLVDTVPHLLMDVGVALNLTNCTFFDQKIENLGHTLSLGRLEDTIQDIQAVQEARTFTTETDI